MFTDFSQLVAQSELHRKELLADADNYRLAKLARSLRRHPPEPGTGSGRGDGSAHSDNHPERRYAVSR